MALEKRFSPVMWRDAEITAVRAFNVVSHTSCLPCEVKRFDLLEERAGCS